MFVYFIPLTVNLTKNSKLEKFVHELNALWKLSGSSMGALRELVAVACIEVLNEILNGSFNAPMLMNPFSVQLLLPAHKKLQIDASMNTLKESSMWISTNKKLSAEKPISKWLVNELTTIMEFSTPIQRNKY
jgi:hypothetical protein